MSLSLRLVMCGYESVKCNDVTSTALQETYVYPTTPRTGLPLVSRALGGVTFVVRITLTAGASSASRGLVVKHQSEGSPTGLGWLLCQLSQWFGVEERFATDSTHSSVVSWLKDRDSPHP